MCLGELDHKNAMALREVCENARPQPLGLDDSFGLGDRLGIASLGGEPNVSDITGLDVVDSRRGSLVLDTDVSALTLVTCYPFDALEPGGPLRYVVTARRRF